jgi:hypothetical protein
METQQMMELLQAKWDANTKALQKQMMADKIADRKQMKEMIAKI